MKNCEWCGGEFEAKRTTPWQRFCSKRCGSHKLDHNKYAADPAAGKAKVKRFRTAHPEYSTDYNDRRKSEMFAAYGGSHCSWPGCPVTDPDMLEIDHVNNDGAEDRKKNGSKMLYRLRREGYPAGYQVLCGSHHLKKHLSGGIVPVLEPDLDTTALAGLFE